MVDFGDNAALLDSVGVNVVAVSVDDAETTASLRESLRLGALPLLHGLDPEVAEATLGVHLAPDRSFVHATGFLLRPDGTVYLSVYSTGALGRLTSLDVARVVDFHQRRES